MNITELIAQELQELGYRTTGHTIIHTIIHTNKTNHTIAQHNPNTITIHDDLQLTSITLDLNNPKLIEQLTQHLGPTTTITSKNGTHELYIHHTQTILVRINKLNQPHKRGNPPRHQDIELADPQLLQKITTYLGPPNTK